MSETSTAIPDDASESAKIREEIKALVPEISAKGQDPNSKDVYPAYIKEIAKEHKVHYNTVKKQWDKVLRDQGVSKSPEPVRTTERTTGEIKSEVTPQPKAEIPKAENKPGQTTGETPAPEPEVHIDEELNAKVLAATHKSIAEALYTIAEAAWSDPDKPLKIKRPDEGVEDFDNPKNPYTQAGRLWAEVLKAYGIEMPKLLVLLGAGANTAMLIAMPLLAGRAEMLKRVAEKEAAKASAGGR